MELDYIGAGPKGKGQGKSKGKSVVSSGRATGAVSSGKSPGTSVWRLRTSIARLCEQRDEGQLDTEGAATATPTDAEEEVPTRRQD
jgi:hypothetical protein